MGADFDKAKHGHITGEPINAVLCIDSALNAAVEFERANPGHSANALVIGRGLLGRALLITRSEAVADSLSFDINPMCGHSMIVDGGLDAIEWFVTSATTKSFEVRVICAHCRTLQEMRERCQNCGAPIEI